MQLGSVSDVVGKGLPAALNLELPAALEVVSIRRSRAERRMRSRQSGTPTKHATAKFITGFYGTRHHRAHAGFYDAGHNPPLLVSKNGECIRLDSGGRRTRSF